MFLKLTTVAEVNSLSWTDGEHFYIWSETEKEICFKINVFKYHVFYVLCESLIHISWYSLVNESQSHTKKERKKEMQWCAKGIITVAPYEQLTQLTIWTFLATGESSFNASLSSICFFKFHFCQIQTDCQYRFHAERKDY